MKKFYLFILILVIFLFQYSVLGVFLESERIPNLFVALSVCLAILFGFEKSLGWIVFAGLLMDSGSMLYLGSGTLVLVIILWGIEKLKVVAELRSKRYFFVFLFSLLVFLSSFIFDEILKIEIRAEKYIFGVTSIFGGFATIRDCLFRYLYSVVFGIGIYFFVRYAKGRNILLSVAKKQR